MKCPKCGYTNSKDALTCNLCGILLKRPGDEASPTEVRESPQPDRPPPFVPRGAPKPAVEDINFCLVCFPLEPFPLDRESPVTIGRSKDNELILPVGMVSRNHARIAWDGQRFVISDLGSANGTIVNGKEVESAALEDGDVIKIGPYSLDFRAYTGDVSNLSQHSKGADVTQNFTRREVLEKAASFAGRIGDMKLEEVFQLIDFNKKTGTLEVTSSDKKGEFHFFEGQLIRAEFNRTQGAAAVARILVLPAGNFNFKAGDPKVERTIFDSTSKVMLEAMRKIDEL